MHSQPFFAHALRKKSGSALVIPSLMTVIKNGVEQLRLASALGFTESEENERLLKYLVAVVDIERAALVGTETSENSEPAAK